LPSIMLRGAVFDFTATVEGARSGPINRGPKPA
jgi:hypothetical protein